MSDSEPAATAPGKARGALARAGVHALAIVGGLAIILFVGVVAVIVLQFGFGRSYEPPKVAAKNQKVSFIVQGGQELAGTNWIKMTVSASDREGDPYGVSSSRGRDDIRNILLVDRASGASRRLLPDNSQRIADSDFLTAEADLVTPGQADALLVADADSALGSGHEPKPPIAYYLLQIERRAPEGNRSTYDLLVGTLASGRQGYVMRGVDGVDLIWMRSPTQIGLMVREKLALYFRVIDIPSLKVVESRRIEID